VSAALGSPQQHSFYQSWLRISIHHMQASWFSRFAGHLLCRLACWKPAYTRRMSLLRAAAECHQQPCAIPAYQAPLTGAH